MQIIDYNGEGIWTREAILARYEAYAQRLGMVDRTDLAPVTHTRGTRHWVYPVMDKVIGGIEQGDGACVELGIDFIEEDQQFTFGMVLKSNTARALRRTFLSEAQKERARRRIVSMLIEGKTYREFRQYYKLLRDIGLGSHWAELDAAADTLPLYARHYYELLRIHVERA